MKKTNGLSRPKAFALRYDCMECGGTVTQRLNVPAQCRAVVWPEYCCPTCEGWPTMQRSAPVEEAVSHILRPAPHVPRVVKP